MVCMSASSTSTIIDDLSCGHDDEVLAWSKKLLRAFSSKQDFPFVNGDLIEV